MTPQAAQAPTAMAVPSRKEAMEKLFLEMDGLKSSMAQALPKHLNAERMIRIVRNAVTVNPKLAQCTRISLLGSIIECSQLGLEPFGAAGHAYLVPYKDGRASTAATKAAGRTVEVYTCQVIVGYRGFLELAERTGRITDLYGECVYSEDRFEEVLGSDRKLIHVPADGERGKLIRAYAVAKLKDGGARWKVIDHRDIARAKAASRRSSYDDSPWVTDEPAMWVKTAVRRLSKWLPMSTEYMHAVDMDERAERGARQMFAAAGREVTAQIAATSATLAAERAAEDAALEVETEAEASGQAAGDGAGEAVAVAAASDTTADRLVAAAEAIKATAKPKKEPRPEPTTPAGKAAASFEDEGDAA